MVDEIVIRSDAIPSINIFISIKVDDTSRPVHQAALKRRGAIVGNLDEIVRYVDGSRIGQRSLEHEGPQRAQGTP